MTDTPTRTSPSLTTTNNNIDAATTSAEGRFPEDHTVTKNGIKSDTIKDVSGGPGGPSKRTRTVFTSAGSDQQGKSSMNAVHPLEVENPLHHEPPTGTGPGGLHGRLDGGDAVTTHANNNDNPVARRRDRDGPNSDSEESAAAVAPSRAGQRRWDRKSKKKKRKKKDPVPESPFVVITRYLFLSVMTLVICVLCPGRTIMWTDPEGSDSTTEPSLNWNQLWKNVAVFFVTVSSFFAVYGSDPGYLTAEVMSDVSLEDGLTLLGHEGRPTDNRGADFGEEDAGDEKTTTYDSIGSGQRRRKPSHSSSSPSPSFDDEENGAGGLLLGQSSSSSSPPARTATAPGIDALAPPAAAGRTEDDPPPFSLSLDVDPPLFRGTRRKPCEVCRIAPPLRAHHCRICKRCVATFDHHCTFVGTCIGERNHCRFWWFLFLQSCGLYVAFHTVDSSSLGFAELFLRWNTSWQVFYVVAAKIYLSVVCLVAYMMLAMHTILALGNLTTFEVGKGQNHIDYLRGTEGFTDLPFSSGLFANLKSFCYDRDASCGYFRRRCCSAQNDPIADDSVAKRRRTAKWIPIIWNPPGKIVRDSEDWWEHPWHNKYWSCC